MRKSVLTAMTAMAVLALAGCGATPSAPTAPVPSRSATPESTAQVQPAGDPTVIASGLKAPWSVVRLSNGSALISERDTAIIKELTADGELRDAGTIAGVAARSEGGLLGIEALEGDDGLWLYAYFTGGSDNRIVRMPVDGDPGSLGLGEASVVYGFKSRRPHHLLGYPTVSHETFCYQVRWRAS